MNLRAHLSTALHDGPRPWGLILFLAIGFALSVFHPSDLKSYHSKSNLEPPGVVVDITENYVRFVNTGVQILLPFAMRDPVGILQLAFIAITTTIATHGTKRLVNEWVIEGTRLGQRPPGGSHSNHNMPSGHSSMTSCAVYYVCWRYGLKFAWLLVPIMLLTMYARIALLEHTVSAVLAGCFLGLMIAATFTSRFRKSAALGKA